METNDRILGRLEPLTPVRRPQGVPAPAEDSAPEPEPEQASVRVEPVRRGFEARLNYDPFEADVFIEILDPQTGDVLRRFPAESADKDSLLRRGGSLRDKLV
jgi:hypothetical protein